MHSKKYNKGSEDIEMSRGSRTMNKRNAGMKAEKGEWKIVDEIKKKNNQIKAIKKCTGEEWKGAVKVFIKWWIIIKWTFDVYTEQELWCDIWQWNTHYTSTWCINCILLIVKN